MITIRGCNIICDKPQKIEKLFQYTQVHTYDKNELINQCADLQDDLPQIIAFIRSSTCYFLNLKINFKQKIGNNEKATPLGQFRMHFANFLEKNVCVN